ncbi:hypothetical protein [Actinophytocola sp.]|uniref:hypothetical protein n=1 Tax=Actinophytocola sp. TaxID=1872138 RepID=UPI002ED0E1B8
MSQQGWTATGVIEAPLDEVTAVFLKVTEGPVNKDNAPLLNVVPGAGRLLGSAVLRGGPTEFTIRYGPRPGGTVEVEVERGYFAFQGGYKFRAEYRFTAHPKGTLLIYRAINVALGNHQDRAAVRFQFWLGGALKVGLRGSLRRIGKALGCRTYAGS